MMLRKKPFKSDYWYRIINQKLSNLETTIQMNSDDFLRFEVSQIEKKFLINFTDVFFHCHLHD